MCGAGANGLAGERDRLRGGAAGAGSTAIKLGPVGKRAPAKQTCGESKKRLTSVGVRLGKTNVHGLLVYSMESLQSSCLVGRFEGVVTVSVAMGMSDCIYDWPGKWSAVSVQQMSPLGKGIFCPRLLWSTTSYMSTFT